MKQNDRAFVRSNGIFKILNSIRAVYTMRMIHTMEQIAMHFVSKDMEQESAVKSRLKKSKYIQDVAVGLPKYAKLYFVVESISDKYYLSKQNLKDLVRINGFSKFLPFPAANSYNNIAPFMLEFQVCRIDDDSTKKWETFINGFRNDILETYGIPLAATSIVVEYDFEIEVELLIDTPIEDLTSMGFIDVKSFMNAVDQRNITNSLVLDTVDRNIKVNLRNVNSFKVRSFQ